MLLTTSAFGQKKDLDSIGRTQYVQTFKNYFFVWPVLKQRSTYFSIQTNDGSQKLTYRPNVTYHLGAGCYIFGVGVQLVAALPPSSASIETYGRSTAVDLQANIIGRHWGADLFTQEYKGYYLEDKNKEVPEGKPSPQRKDISTWNNGVTGIYFFNKRRYSMRSTYNYYERQLKSAGSILLSGNFNAFSIRCDSALYDRSYEAAFGPGPNFQRADYSTFSIAPGYAYNLVVLKSFFISASYAFGPALNWFKDADAVSKSVSFEVNTYSDLRIAVGYNGQRFFTGIVFNHLNRNVAYEGVLFSNSNDNFKFALGYRFREVGILKRRAYDIFRPKSSL